MENMESFEDLLNDYLQDISSGEKVTGILFQKDNNCGYIEIPNIKGFGKIKLEEIKDYSVNDEIEVIILNSEEDKHGNISVSRMQIEKEAGFQKLQKSFEEKLILSGKITRENEKGYLVNILSHRAFLPKSLSLKNNIVNNNYDFIVKDIKSMQNIILSQKEIINIKKSEVINSINLDDIINVKIKEILNFGLVVSYKEVTGFIHISELSWRKINNINDFFKVDDLLEAKVILIDTKKQNLKLSIRKLIEDPWINFNKNYKIDDIVKGIVTEIKSFGVVVLIENEFNGFIHISNLTWDRRFKNIKNIVMVGDILDVQILDFDLEKRNLKLSLKAIQDNPWEEIETKYPINSVQTGNLIHKVNYGIFVGLEDGVEAFIHISDLDWISPNISKFNINDKIDFTIINIDKENQRIKGSIKQNIENPYTVIFEKYKQNDIIDVNIVNIIDAGAIVEIENNVTGLIPTNEIEEKTILKKDDTIKALIFKMDSTKKRILLSIKKLEEVSNRADLDEMLKIYGNN